MKVKDYIKELEKLDQELPVAWGDTWSRYLYPVEPPRIEYANKGMTEAYPNLLEDDKDHVHAVVIIGYSTHE